MEALHQMKIKRKLYYFGFYVDEEHIKEREPIMSPATTAKMAYIADCLANCFDVIIVSPGFSSAIGKFSSKVVSESRRKVIYLPSKGDGKKFLSLRKVFFARARIAEFINKQVDSDSLVLIYSQPWINDLATKVLKKKGLRYVLELEELHATNHKNALFKRILQRISEKQSIENAESLIVVNDLLKNINKKKSVVCHGKYLPENFIDSNLYSYDSDQRVNLLYSGGIDYERGIFLLLESLKLMPSHYKKALTLQISGYFHGGNSRRIRIVFEERIKDLRDQGVDIVFHGTIRNEDLDKLVKKCEICISPQLIENEFSKYSFPSKILFYLTKGKLVISSGIPSVLKSPFSRFLVLYTRDDPRLLANAIMKAIDGVEDFYTKQLFKLYKILKDEHNRFSMEVIQLFHDFITKST